MEDMKYVIQNLSLARNALREIARVLKKMASEETFPIDLMRKKRDELLTPDSIIGDLK